MIRVTRWAPGPGGMVAMEQHEFGDRAEAIAFAQDLAAEKTQAGLASQRVSVYHPGGRTIEARNIAQYPIGAQATPISQHGSSFARH